MLRQIFVRLYMKQGLKVLLLFGILLLLALNAMADQGKPKMVIARQTHDAGAIYRTVEKIEHAFVIRNTGTADLKILSAQPG